MRRLVGWEVRRLESYVEIGNRRGKREKSEKKEKEKEKERENPLLVAADREVRDARAVGAGGEVLVDGEPARVEHGRLRL